MIIGYHVDFNPTIEAIAITSPFVNKTENRENEKFVCEGCWVPSHPTTPTDILTEEMIKMTKEQFEEAREIVATLDELKYGLEYIERMKVDEIVIKGLYTDEGGYTRSDGVHVPYRKYNDETLVEVVEAIKKIINEKIKKFEDQLEKL